MLPIWQSIQHPASLEPCIVKCFVSIPRSSSTVQINMQLLMHAKWHWHTVRMKLCNATAQQGLLRIDRLKKDPSPTASVDGERPYPVDFIFSRMGMIMSNLGRFAGSSFMQILTSRVMCCEVPGGIFTRSPSVATFIPTSMGDISANGTSRVANSHSKIA